MLVAEIVLLAMLGSALGSFLNLTMDRIPRGESLFLPGSHCDACYHRLGFTDLVPIASYIRLLGRCRYCSCRISYRVPLVEVLTAAGCAFLAIPW